MQYLQNENNVMLLTDEKEIVTLDKAVQMKAMALYEDVYCMRQGIKNSNGNPVSCADLELDIRILNALSNALLAAKKLEP